MKLILQPDALDAISELFLHYPNYQSVAAIREFFNVLGVKQDNSLARLKKTRQCLGTINNTETMEAFLLQWLAPYRFKGDYDFLDYVIEIVNFYLQYDHVIIQREGNEIQFKDFPKGVFLKPRLTPRAI